MVIVDTDSFYDGFDAEKCNDVISSYFNMNCSTEFVVSFLT